MGMVVAALAVIGTYIAALAAVDGPRRRPVALAAPLALTALVVFEALLLDALSLVRGVTAPALVACHVAAVGAAFAFRGARAALVSQVRRGVRSVHALGPPALLLVPVALLITLSAARYVPSNWDSMTYRLARVAHWLQHRSVAPYPTHVERQVIYQPGAEYVLAALQGMSGSDRLAAFLQLAAWGMVVLASPALARLAGAPRRLAPWSAVIVGALPMGVLQASSTQNDLVAAAITIATIVAVVPFLHRVRRWRVADAVVLGLALGAGVLVKATAVVAAAPFVVLALWRTARATPRRPGAAVLAVAIAGAVAAIPVAPEVYRRLDPGLAAPLRAHAAEYTYAGAGELRDRLTNVVRGLVRNLPSPPALVEAVGIPRATWCAPGAALCTGQLLREHEDFAGNPAHVGLLFLAGCVALARWRRVPPRAALFLSGVPAAWISFHLVFRDNAWITRLQTPDFALSGLAVAAWASRARPREAPAVPAGPVRPLRGAAALTALGAGLALAISTNVALENETRPPLGGLRGPMPVGYYPNQSETIRIHFTVLEAARRNGCSRLGLVIGEDSYDYPLTWRAQQRGIEVRHVFGADPWPCLIFSDQHPGVEVVSANGWRATSEPFLFANARAAAR